MPLNTIKRIFANKEKINLANVNLIHYVLEKPWIENKQQYSEINKVWFKYFNELSMKFNF